MAAKVGMISSINGQMNSKFLVGFSLLLKDLVHKGNRASTMPAFTNCILDDQYLNNASRIFHTKKIIYAI